MNCRCLVHLLIAAGLCGPAAASTHSELTRFVLSEPDHPPGPQRDGPMTFEDCGATLRAIKARIDDRMVDGGDGLHRYVWWATGRPFAGLSCSADGTVRAFVERE